MRQITNVPALGSRRFCSSPSHTRQNRRRTPSYFAIGRGSNKPGEPSLCKALKDAKAIRPCTNAYSLSSTGTHEDKKISMESLQKTWFQRWNMFELLINGNLHPNWNISHPSVLPWFFPLTCSPSLMNTQDSAIVWYSMTCICRVGRNRDLCSRPVIPKFLFFQLIEGKTMPSKDLKKKILWRSLFLEVHL